MSNNFISALEEQFNKDCKVVNIRYEYEGFSGTERYIIASCLTEKEIWNKYPKQAKLYAPFVRVDLSFIEVRQKYINNEDKFCKRAKRTQDIFNFDETTAVFHKELLVNDFVLERALIRNINAALMRTFGIRHNNSINTIDIRCLCQKHLKEYKLLPEYIIKRFDPLQVKKDKCDKCNDRGYDYVFFDKKEVLKKRGRVMVGKN